MLQATGLSHRYDYPLFEQIDFALSPSESVAVLGVSGSGKSTLLHILSSFIPPQEGTVRLLGEEIYALKPKALDRLRRNDLGIVFQHHYLFRGFTGAENLEVASLLSGEPMDPELLEKLGIDKVVKQNAFDLSGGQQQRVSIARVLTKKPRLIFADEPTGNLDRITADEVMEILFGYVKEKERAMFLVTHDDKIARSCDRVFLLENQRLRQL